MDTTVPINHTSTTVSPSQIASSQFAPTTTTPPPSQPPPKPPQQPLAEYPGHRGFVLKVLLVLFVLLVVGFGAFFYMQSKTKKTEPVSLTYWGVQEDSNVMGELITDFEKDHPMIKITYLQQDKKNYLEKILTRTQNGTGPDIYSFHNTWTPMLVSLLLPMPTSVIKPSDIKDNYFPVVQHDMMYRGAVYGIPLGFDTLALFTNSQILHAAGASVPVTWNDFNDTARQLTVQGDNNQIVTAGAAMGNTENVAHAPDILSLLFLQSGANLYDLSSSAQSVSEGLQFFANFQPDVWNASLDPSLLAFSKGNLAMYIGYSWDIFTIKSQNPSLTFEVHPMPSLADRKMTVASYYLEGVSSNSKHKKEALLFMEYLAQKQTLKKFYAIASKARLFGEPYPRRDLAEDLKTNTLVAPFISQGDIAQPSYFIGDVAESGINAKANDVLSDAVKSMSGNFTTADAASQKLLPQLTQLLQQYGY